MFNPTSRQWFCFYFESFFHTTLRKLSRFRWSWTRKELRARREFYLFLLITQLLPFQCFTFSTCSLPHDRSYFREFPFWVRVKSRKTSLLSFTLININKCEATTNLSPAGFHHRARNRTNTLCARFQLFLFGTEDNQKQHETWFSLEKSKNRNQENRETYVNEAKRRE